MTAVLLGVMFGIGVMLMLSAQSHGAPKPSFASRVAALRPDTLPEPRLRKERVFRTDLFEEIVRPAIEHAGEVMAAAAGRLGLDINAIEEQLRLVGDRGGTALHFGQKIAHALLGFALLPMAGAAGLAPRTPLLLWIVAAAGGFLMPDVVLRSRAREARRRLREELVHLAELLTLAVSAGMGIESALDHVARTNDGRLFAEVRRLLDEASLRGEPATAALTRLPAEVGLAEAEPLATALRTAAVQGTHVTQALAAQARSLRERRRVELIEAGERAQVRMILPVALVILPAFLVVVLYPAAAQLLRIAGP